MKQCADLSDRLYALQLTEESILNSPANGPLLDTQTSHDRLTDRPTDHLEDRSSLHKRPNVSPLLKTIVTQSPNCSVYLPERQTRYPSPSRLNDSHCPNNDYNELTSLLRRKNANTELKNIAIRWSQLLTDPATSDSFSSVAILDGVSLTSSNDACSICKDEHGHGSCQGWYSFALRKTTSSNSDLSNMRIVFTSHFETKVSQFWSPFTVPK